MAGLHRGEVEAGAGEEAAEQAGAVLHALEPGLDQGGELGEVAFGQAGRGTFPVRPDRFHRVQLVRTRREPADRQPVSRRDQAGHRVADVHIQVAPHHDEGPASCWWAASRTARSEPGSGSAQVLPRALRNNAATLGCIAYLADWPLRPSHQ